MKTKLTFTLGFIFSTFSWAQVPENYTKLLNEGGLTQNDQSFCYEHQLGLKYQTNINKKMKPASVTKLYVTDWAFAKVSKDLRYETKFFIKDKKLFILGGQDSFFVTESVTKIIEHLNSINITELEEIVFDKYFYLNWLDNPQEISTLLLKYFNPSKMNQQTLKELSSIRQRNLFLNIDSNPLTLKMKVKKISYANEINIQESDIAFTFKSSPLYKHIKQMNIYSTNFMAQKLFDFLGGVDAFHAYIKETYNKDESEFYFYTGSGLGENYTTCAITLEMLKHLEKGIEESGLRIQDVVSVAGTDDGTLNQRFTEADYKNIIRAKTGTLKDRTTLAGYLAFDGGLHYFTIFNHTWDLAAGRTFQNKLVKQLIKNEGTKLPFDYQKIEYSPIEDIIIE